MTEERPLRLLVFDRTCVGPWYGPGLSHAWAAGYWLYRGLGRFDARCGVATWDEGLAWLATVVPGREIGEIQFWGHGHWGCARVGEQRVDADALVRSHPLNAGLRRVRERLVDGDGGGVGVRVRWWFRTCETFGADAGHAFARDWTDFFGAAAAGHTYIIGPWQSGLHRLRPGDAPDWSADEGLRDGTAASPERALWSRRDAPNTISCLRGEIPDGF